MKFIITFLIIINFLYSFCQQKDYDLKPLDKDFTSDCGKFNAIFFNKPKEIEAGIVINEQNQILFYTNAKDWFLDFISSNKDGITIDIVTKDQYNCNRSKPYFNQKILQKGELYPPVFKKDLVKNAYYPSENVLVYSFGMVPYQYKDKKFEINTIYINDKRTCLYYSTFNIKRYRWDLLDMGLYSDTIISSRLGDSIIYSTIKNESVDYLTKKMIFNIPFEKNKVNYSPLDVKAIYDSLNATDYYIKSISIHSYSSVEGSEAINNEIQQQRAASIINAIQSYQKPHISTEINVSENWVDFFDDIQSTQYKTFENLAKAEIKDKLKDSKVLDRLEPYLKNHRKAVLKIELSKINKYENMSSQELILNFNRTISENDFEKAKSIQDALFESIKSKKSGIDALDNLEIPDKLECSLLHNNRSIFEFAMSRNSTLETLQKFEELASKFPKDLKINHNKLVFKFKAYIQGYKMINASRFESEINYLSKLGENPFLLKKLFLNNAIIMAEVYMMKGEYAKKDEKLKYIMNNYKQNKMDAIDILSMAQYFMSFNQMKFAIDIVSPFCQQTGVNEDLLFYYLNLTIINENYTKDKNYKKILFNAASANKSRFCEIFEPNHENGITFQLLENPILKKIYCDYCQE